MSFRPINGASPSPSTTSSVIEPTSPSALFDSLRNAPAETPKAEAKPTPKPDESGEAVLPPDDSAEAEETPEEGMSDEGAVADDGEEAAPANTFEVTHRGKKIAFNLDKNDKKLQQTLAYGLEAPKLAAEKKEYKRRAEAAEAKLASAGDVGKYSEAMEMAKAGYVASAVKELLGDELYKTFYNEEILGRIDYDSASPEERVQLVTKRSEREKAELQWKLERVKGSQNKSAELSKEAQAKALETELEGYAKSAISRHDFKKLDSSPEAQEEYKVSVYHLAMQDIENWVEANTKAGKSVTPTQAHIERAIERKYKLLTGQIGRGKTGGSAKPAPSASGKKAAAKASQNYDKGATEELNGLSPFAIFNKMRGNK